MKNKKQLTEAEYSQINKDIQFIQQSILKAKKLLKKYGKIK